MLEHLDQFGALNRTVGVAMLDDCLGNMDRLPTKRLPTQAQLDVFVVQKVLRVEAAHFTQILRMYDHGRAAPQRSVRPERAAHPFGETTIDANAVLPNAYSCVLDDVVALPTCHVNSDLSRTLYVESTDCPFPRADPNNNRSADSYNGHSYDRPIGAQPNGSIGTR